MEVATKKLSKEFPIQKVDYYNRGSRSNLVTVEMNYERGRFSASANVWNANKSDIYMGGQCFVDLISFFPELKENELFMEIYDLWKNYHLNDMHAGTPEQEKAIEEWKATGNEYNYERVCEYLKSIDLYEVPISTIDLIANPSFEGKEGTYRYGTAWLNEIIPEKDVERILYLYNNERPLVKEIDFDSLKVDDYEMEM